MVSTDWDGFADTVAVFRSRGEPLTAADVAAELGRDPDDVTDRLERLVERGDLATRTVGEDRRIWWSTGYGDGDTETGIQEAGNGGLSSEGVLVVDEDGTVAWVDEYAARYFGVEQSAAVGRDRDELVRERLVDRLVDPQASDPLLADHPTRDDGVTFALRAAEGRPRRRLRHASEPIDSGRFAGGRVEFYVDVTGEETRRSGSADQKDLFRSLVAATEEYAIFMLDAEGHVVSWNRGAERIKGYDTDEILGEHFSTFYTETDVAAGVPEQNLERAAERGSVEDEGWRVRADGIRFWANVTITALYHDDGSLRGFAKVTRDMTDRREWERELEQERDLLERVLDAVPVSVGVVERDGRFVRANEQARQRLGTDELDGDAYEIGERDVFDEDGEPVPPDERPHARVFETGESVEGWPCQIDLPDHGRRWLSVDAEPLTNDEGEVESVVLSADDVTQIREQAARLQRERDELASELDDVFERVTDAFFAADEDWHLTYVNDRAEAVLDISHDEVLGESLWAEFPEAIDSAFWERFLDVMESQEPGHFEAYYEPLGEWFAVDAYPSETGLSVYFRTVTERKERERELERHERIVENVPVGVYRNTPGSDGTFVEANERLAEIFDADSLAEFRQCSVSDLYADPEQRAEFSARLREEGVVEDVELKQETLAGEEIWVSVTAILVEEDGETYFDGVIQDVTDRKEREEELATRVTQQAVVADLGQLALESPDLDELFETASERVADTLDNDYCKVLDLDPERGELDLRAGVGWQDGYVGAASVADDESSQAGYTLASAEPVVVSDMDAETRFEGPDLLLDHDVQAGISVVVGSPDDPWGVLGTHDTRTREYSDNDALFVQAVANILATAIERRANERAIDRQHEQLSALNNLNAVYRDITEALVQQSTREEIEQTVCERLADSESYSFAWTCEIDPRDRSVEPRVQAGVDGYLDEAPVSTDADEPSGQGPTGKAVRSREVQVVRDAFTDPDYEIWREYAEKYGFRSSAAIPITYEDTIYGVLNVYTDRPDAFNGQELAVVGQLGEIVGHAIAATERKQALMSDEVVEVEFRIEDVARTVGAAELTSGTVDMADTVPIGDGKYLVYGTATPDGLELLETLRADIDYWEELTVVESDFEETRFELQMSDAPVASAVASRGGYIEEARIANGDYHMVIHLPPTVDVRSVIETVQNTYSTAEMVTRRQFSREDHRATIDRTLTEELTDRQRAALEVSYHSGFFEWPRESSGEEVAESLGVSAPTFHQHLRKAQQKVFDALLT